MGYSAPLFIWKTQKLENGKIENTECPAVSPDFNPIELVWDELDRRLKAKQPTWSLPSVTLAV